MYELAWASEEQDPAAALNWFQKLAQQYPTSPLASECWYRVGEAKLAADDTLGAIKSYQSALDHTDDDDLREKALHKLAWAYFESGDTAQAADVFDQQLSEFAQGELATDGRLMRAECHFKLEEFDEALEKYETALSDRSLSESLRPLALLHAGQAAVSSRSGKRVCNYCGATRSTRVPTSYREKSSTSKVGHCSTCANWTKPCRCLRTWPTRIDRCLVPRKIHDGRSPVCEEGLRTGRSRFLQGCVWVWGRSGTGGLSPLAGGGDVRAARCLEQSGREQNARKLYRELVERFPRSAKATHARNLLQ